MAYQQNTGSKVNFRQPASSSKPVVAATTDRPKAIFSTGLFAPNKEGVRSKGSVQLKEDVILPAGSYINLYENEDRKGDTSPVFKLQVTPGKLKSQS